ncbi:MAG: AraC family transcriptional regulator [candidate division WOR-3 bacterium]|nr:MAG: AraC family transcriptional regulator [candidate division WOR-3 bacterium]
MELKYFLIIFLIVSFGFVKAEEGFPVKGLEPEIVELGDMTVVGLQILYSSKCNLIPQLWERFMPRIHEIKDVARKDVGLEVSYDMQDSEGKETFFVIAGLIVNSTTHIPEGMTYKHISAHEYAKFTHQGPISEISSTYNFIYKEWLPASAYEHDDEGCEVEWYDERFKMEDEDSEFDIYVPIKQKS